MENEKRIKPGLYILAGGILLTLVLVWSSLSGAPLPGIYFLDVGQGDSELVILPGGASILTDAGPDRSILEALDRIVPELGRIDLAVISHPQLDHFGGYNFLIDKYAIGAVILNGRADGPGVAAWRELLEKISAKNIPVLTLGAGDSISYGRSRISFLSPDNNYLESGELNDTGLVEYIHTPEWKAVFLADIGEAVENSVFKKTWPADIVKIAHHGSKYSTGSAVLAAIRPKAAIIEVGARNSYGHPAKRVLDDLARAGIRVFRTDLNGSISVHAEGGKLVIASEKRP